MGERGYKRVDSESDGGSRGTSLDLKRNEGRSEDSHIANEDEDFFAWRKAYLTRVNIFPAVVIALFLLTVFNVGFRRQPPQPEPEIGPPNPEYNRIAKVSMLFGEPNEAYERGLTSHKRHAARWGYPFYVLKRDEGCGFWTKLVYLMSILGLELQKDPEDRVEWLMWGDADSVILNPNIPVSIFLPPKDLPHIHFVGTRDWNGLNNGVFFLRVHPWSVSMLTSAMSYPLCHQDVDLGANVEQEGMRLTFARPSGGTNDLGWRSGVVYMPKVWFNTYEMAMGDADNNREAHPEYVVDYPGLKMKHYYEGTRGNMLVHGPGVSRDLRNGLLLDWMDLIEKEYIMQYGSLNATTVLNETEYMNRTMQWDNHVNTSSSRVWSLPLEKTNYPNMTTSFWNRYRAAMDVIVEATSGATSINIAEAALGLRVALSEEADNIEVIEEKIDQMRRMMRPD